ncbi:hypothetical protein HN011_009605 [Eciton burchellii]|nr:hypothetical protein HN011_009605 [Eciton burchellii]
MDFPGEYYKLNYVLLSAIGLWPYDNFKVRYFRFILSLLILISFTSPQLMKLFVSKYNLDLYIKVFSFNAFFIIISIRFVTFYGIMENVKEFRNRIQNNNSALIDNREFEIIRKYANVGRLCTVIIVVFVYVVNVIFVLTQYISILLDIAIPLNESRPRKLLFVTEYFIDQEKYFHILVIHLAIGMLILITTVLATETFALTNAIYAFGLFKIASYRMEHILSDINTQMSNIKRYILSRSRIIAAVDFHRRAIEYGELLRTSFTLTYLALFVVLVLSMGINLFNLSRLIMKRKIWEIIISVFFILFHIIYLTIPNCIGQEFINYDTQVYRTICNTQWYNAPLKTQSLILFLIQKTTKTYKVNAGGMFSPCLEGLLTGFSMSVSYFMVFNSV